MKSPYLEGISLCHMCVKAKMSAAGDYYDTNQWHWIRDAAAYHQVCNTIMLRACWRDTAGVFRVDSRFAEDRRRFNNLAALGHYHGCGTVAPRSGRPTSTPTPPILCRPTNGRWLISRPGRQTQRIFYCGG